MIETMAGEHRQPRGAGLVVVTPAVSWRSRRRVVWSSGLVFSNHRFSHGFPLHFVPFGPLIDAEESPVSRALMSGLLCGACRWPLWVFACVPGTSLVGVLEAHALQRYCLDCLDHSLSHHAVQRFLPD
jgi:hypothetical protein